MNQARLDLAAEFPSELAGLTSEHLHALEQALANAWHEGWEPIAGDVAMLVSSLREGGGRRADLHASRCRGGAAPAVTDEAWESWFWPETFDEETRDGTLRKLQDWDVLHRGGHRPSALPDAAPTLARQERGDCMDRKTAAAIAQKVGATAIVYYPEIHADELDFVLADEVSWCLEGVDGLEAEDEAILRDTITRTIIDPTAYRPRLNEALNVLLDDVAA